MNTFSKCVAYGTTKFHLEKINCKNIHNKKQHEFEIEKCKTVKNNTTNIKLNKLHR